MKMQLASIPTSIAHVKEDPEVGMGISRKIEKTTLPVEGIGDLRRMPSGKNK